MGLQLTGTVIKQTNICQFLLDRYEEGPDGDGLIQTSLLDMPDINVGSDAQIMFNTIDIAIKSAKLSWDYCMTYCSDMTILTQWGAIALSYPPFLLMILVQNFMLIKNHIEIWV